MSLCVGVSDFTPSIPAVFFALVLLSYLSYRQALGRPGFHQESLESVDCLDITTL